MILRAGAPRLIVGAAGGTCALFVVAALLARGTGWLLFLLLSVIAFLAGRIRARPTGALAVALLLGGVAASQVINYDDNSIVPEVMLPLTLYLAGVALRSRELLAGRLSEQADEINAERHTYAQLSIRYERARIAAELHDVVAHALSMMVVQASAGQRLADRDPSRTTETFKIIASAARQAEADLDRLADLLAEDASPDDGAHLGLLNEIVDAARASGLPVTLRVTGDSSSITGTVAHAALRVVQEGVTNALRYAPGAVIEVTVDARPGTLELSIINGKGTAPARLGLGSGRGLTGLRERIAACGGTLQAGPDREEGWTIHAWIPC
jgi:signal transduction histidine kinase